MWGGTRNGSLFFDFQVLSSTPLPQKKKKCVAPESLACNKKIRYTLNYSTSSIDRACDLWILYTLHKENISYINQTLYALASRIASIHVRMKGFILGRFGQMCLELFAPKRTRRKIQMENNWAELLLIKPIGI